ncbi:MAG: hypothetical protein WCQ70_10070 [Lentimicrobiaceae bacterium]
MYITEILWLLTWPAMIALSFYLIVICLKKFDHQIKNDPNTEDIRP